MDIIAIYNLYKVFRSNRILQKLNDTREIISYNSHSIINKKHKAYVSMFGARRTSETTHLYFCANGHKYDAYKVTKKNTCTLGYNRSTTITTNVTNILSQQDMSNGLGHDLGPISYMPYTCAWNTDVNELLASQKYKYKSDAIVGALVCVLCVIILSIDDDVFDAFDDDVE